MTKTELVQMIGCSSATITKIGRNEYVALEVMERICAALDCQPCDVIECSKEAKQLPEP
ncbi:MAG: helix-turn-helix transcriptional regulator [Eubacteriales bacterium]|nr:helix-turn-helix transcriptional regulator [Eubacteriales bacterium]